MRVEVISIKAARVRLKVAPHVDFDFLPMGKPGVEGARAGAAATLFARQSLDLLVQLLDESHRDGRTAAETVRAAVVVAGGRVIARRFGEPDLTPASIARDVGVSSRTLERAFAAHGETVMRRVFDERLSQAARHLRSASSAHRSITDIAFNGYSSRFSRAGARGCRPHSGDGVARSRSATQPAGAGGHDGVRARLRPLSWRPGAVDAGVSDQPIQRHL